MARLSKYSTKIKIRSILGFLTIMKWRIDNLYYVFIIVS